MRPTRRALAAALSALGLAGLASPAAAHTGTTHAGTPHWVLLLLVVVGLAGVGLGVRAVRRGGRELGALGIGAGTLLLVGGGIGLVEIQVTPEVAPAWSEWFTLLNVGVAVALALGSLVVVRWRWPERPRYVALGGLLAAWTAYPAVMPNGGLTHPLGYLVALGLPLVVGYVLWRDAGSRLRQALGGRAARIGAALTFLVFTVFFAVSSGTLTLNPDTGVGLPDHAFLTVQGVASPLVYWPAVEFYAPSVPVAGYVSVGSLVLLAVLGGLVALNAGLVVRQWSRGGSGSPRAMAGALASSGATACCCCAPAVYGVVGAAFGTAASPVYWAFLNPASPVGGLFLSASVILLTGSAVRSAEDACRLPGSDAGVDATAAD
jgi:hypothetical protein